jgi:hypothetical protein
METSRPHDDGTTMRRWMRAVGVLFLLLGIFLLPWINHVRVEAVGLELFYSGGDLTSDDTVYRYLLDWLGVFGMTLLALGGVLLVAARNPIEHRSLVHVVIWHEVGSGILADAWFISRDYAPDAVNWAFIALHLVVIATGIRALRRTPRPVAPTSTPAPATAAAA